MIEVRKVEKPSEMKAFVRLPEKIYRENPHWAPPIWMDEKNAYRPENNPILAHSDYELFLAYKNGEPVGRNLVYIDREFNKYYRTKIGFFGAFECEDDSQIAATLLTAAETWLAEKGMTSVRGPIHPVAEVWGFLAESFDTPPIFLSPYNPQYYLRFMDEFGYDITKKLLVYKGDAEDNYVLPERFAGFTDRLMKHRPNITVRPIDMKNLKSEAEHIWRISNAALSDNWGYVPVEYEIMLDMLRKVRPLVNPESVCFVEDNGEAVGYAFGFVDLNVVLKQINGNLLPFGFIKLLRGIKRVRDYRLFGLAVLPEYHGMGLDVLLYVKLYQGLLPKNASLEANYILEDNYSIRNALEKLGLRRTKSYHVYEKPLIQ